VSRLATVEIHKEELKFSGGHFMIFSAHHRETMHGHDYQMSVAFDCMVGTNGLSFDCRYYKNKLLVLCQMLDYHFILPQHSEFLQLEQQSDKWIVKVNGDTMSFLKKDVVVLPITNVTLEELSNWFLQQITKNKKELEAHTIHSVRVKIFNGRGESGASYWTEAAWAGARRNENKIMA
jgi:6-pyruvoyltetrahydropterin/6-carboxytetrahydropterin synthase